MMPGAIAVYGLLPEVVLVNCSARIFTPQKTLFISSEPVFSPLRSADLPFVHQLYEAAFPLCERRSWNQLSGMLSVAGEMQVRVARQHNEPVGFAIYWQVEGWYFLEHLAIHPQQEGRGLGRACMQWLLQQSGQCLLLEAEWPTDAYSTRRIRFYEKLGLGVSPFPYRQPPYRPGETTPQMYLMSAPVIYHEHLFRKLTTAIRQQVFEAFYETGS